MGDMMGASLQENILTALCFDTKAAKQICAMVTPEYFEARHYRIIAEAALGFLSRYKEAPGDHIADLLESHLVDHDRKSELMERTLQALYDAAPGLNAEYVINSTLSFVSDQKLKLAITDAVSYIQRGESDKARSTILNGAKLIDTGSDLGYDFYKDSAYLLAEDEESSGWSTGIHALDRLHLTLDPGTLTMILANANRGKSWALIHMGRALAMQRKKVLHITLEMSDKKTARRYVQCFTSSSIYEADGNGIDTMTVKDDKKGGGIELGRAVIHRPSMARDSKKVLDMHRHKSSRAEIHIKQFPTATLTVDGFVAYMDALEATTGFIPDAVIIDYIDLFAMSADNLRHEIANTNKRLRGVAIERNFALISASQANREAETAKVVTLRHLAEAYNKSMDSDTIISYAQTPAERRLHLARLYIAKARDSGADRQVLITQCYEVGQFALESVALDGTYWESLDDADKGGEKGGDDSDQS